MVVKAKTGRRRYIVFKILKGDDITRKDLIYTFNRTLPLNQIELEELQNGKITSITFPKVEDSSQLKEAKIQNNLRILRHQLKYFDGKYGILLCPHWLKTYAIETIVTINQVGYYKKDVKMESVGTSGTLKKAMKKYLI